MKLWVSYGNEDFDGDVDKEGIRKVVSNVVRKGKKYRGRRIEVGFEEDGEKERLWIEVKENGKGMNEEEVKKILKGLYEG